ncbi:hypothetical protein [Hyalangium gracile]|uniref:hypothetical protein n=1 Tax=Hyalangium gracile TaxID=394092 RepID=UPI001CCF2214|nr:hypothetical protein [Hyalangium gracile]
MSTIDSAFKAAAGTPGLSQSQLDVLAGLPPDQQRMMAAQMQLDKEQQAVSLISNIMKKLNDMSMAIINNMR